ncbi:MAG: PilZ domain-containing protein [Dehalococcoidia bacterium]|nr:PilZ domain-containing protein [Dehalococcoidia bacterium]
MDDDLGPIESAAPGMAVSVMPRGASATGYGQGVLEACRGFSIYVATHDRAWRAGDEVVLACGAMGRRVAALARFRDYGQEQAVFSRQSPWRPFNRRVLERYPVHISATLDGPGQAVPVAVTDISMGGAAVLVSETPDAARSLLRLTTPAGQAVLPVAVAGGHADEAGTVLHLRFEDMAPEAALVVETLVASLVAGIAAEAA